MLYNFITKSSDEAPLKGITWRTIDAETEQDAIQIYILSDAPRYHDILYLIGGEFLDVEGRDKEEIQDILESLSLKFERTTGFDAFGMLYGEIDIENDYDNDIYDLKYQRFLYDNLDEIKELINEMIDIGLSLIHI